MLRRQWLKKRAGGHVAKRVGTNNLFGCFQPLVGWRHLKVTEHRTKIDFAQCMKDLVDVYFPNAVKINIVKDTLNTLDISALYEAFEPAEALRIARQAGVSLHAQARFDAG